MSDSDRRERLNGQILSVMSKSVKARLPATSVLRLADELQFCVENERWYLATACCVIAGELIFLSGQKQLRKSTYNVQKLSKDERDTIHYPMMLLRNSVLHPASGLSALASRLKEQPEWQTLATKLENDPTQLQTQEMTRWAIMRLDGIGHFELTGHSPSLR